MPERVVTIATFGDPFEAHLARSKLVDAGIDAIVIDENTQALYGYNSSISGGAKLQVRQSDVRRALRVLGRVGAPGEPSEQTVYGEAGGLEEPERMMHQRVNERLLKEEITEAESADDVEFQAVCPRCGSTQSHEAKFSAGTIALSLLLLGIPLLFLEKRWVCEECGTRWKERW